MIRLRAAANTRIPKDLRAFVRWLNGILSVPHNVVVHVCPRVYGFFDAPRLSADEPRVIMGLDDDYIDTLAHELEHYAQWRDKREVTEKGVERRARALVKRFRREAA